jgi:hypothetical protein
MVANSQVTFWLIKYYNHILLASGVYGRSHATDREAFDCLLAQSPNREWQMTKCKLSLTQPRIELVGLTNPVSKRIGIS